ncbi:unnamed protein product [Rotaria sp. Silwood1]|nr:unnamed protein product [Rotaria sp. Silwood1]
MNVSVPLPHSKYSALSLSPVIIDDALEMTILLNDEETVKYLIGPPHPLSIERVKDYISSRPSVNGHCLAWAIRHNEKLIGEYKNQFNNLFDDAYSTINKYFYLIDLFIYQFNSM